MKRIFSIVFVFSLIILANGCMSAPQWSGAETEAGEFVWKAYPGTRFYINLGVLGAILIALIVMVIKTRLEQTPDQDVKYGTCLGWILAIVGIPLFANLSSGIWMAEKISIDSERVERTYSTSVYSWETQTLSWADVNVCRKFRDNETYGMKSMRTGVTWTEGEIFEGLALLENEKTQIKFVLKKEVVGRGVVGYLFGEEGYTVSPEEEARLKAVIKKYMPEKAKQKLLPETKEYLEIK